MASFSRSGKNWRVQVLIKGIRESRSFSTKGEASAWAAERETEIRNQKLTGLIAGKTCKDAFERYEKEVSRLKRGFRWEAHRLSSYVEKKVGSKKFGEMLLTELTPDFLGKWRDMRLTVDKVKGSTVNRDLNLLSHVFTTANREWGWMKESPTKFVRRPKDPAPRDRLINADEIERLCLATGFSESLVVTKTQAVGVAFLFAIETAMRAGEICGLRPKDLNGQVAHLPMTKNGLKRDVPLSLRAVCSFARRIDPT